jgi:tRNA pseudouridine38-40 synthase
MRIAAGVEYCGAGFDGWQRHPGHRTVQECVEAALSIVADHGIEVYCAGRTDAGVHAVQQVIHFDTSSERENHSWVFGANSNLPDDININWVMPLEDDFHARFSALSRRYKYYIVNRPTRTAIFKGLVTWEVQKMDESRMMEAARSLIGEHDFTSYRATSCQSKTSIRNVSHLDVLRVQDMIIIDIQANAFLHHMVRNIAGVLMKIGMCKQQISWTKELLVARDRAVGGITAPADGLYLTDISYPDKFNIPVSQELIPHLLKSLTGREAQPILKFNNVVK